MTDHHPNRRKTDTLLIACASLGLLAAFAVGILIAPVLLATAQQADRSAQLAIQLEREGAERRDQMCRLFETQHAIDVERLYRTYEYLNDLPRAEWGKPLTRAIVVDLPRLEDEARRDSAPAFCDEEGVGLPEPDPDLPARRNFDRLLERP